MNQAINTHSAPEHTLVPAQRVMTSDREIPGLTQFATGVVEIVAGIAAREVPGVHKLGKGLLKDTMARVGGTLGTSRGVSAEVGKQELAVDLEMVVEYGYNMHEVASAVRSLVAHRLSALTDLVVKEVNIAVVDVHYQRDAAQPTRRVE